MMRIGPEPKKEAPVVPKKDDPKAIASELLKGLEEQLQSVIEFANQGKPESTAAKVPEPVKEVEPAPVEPTIAPKLPDIEVKVFKHKDVNTLIRSRILALETSVVTKNIERKPLQELDKTINGVKLTEDNNDFNPIGDTYPVKIDNEPTKLPTSNIKNLVASSKAEPHSHNFLTSPPISDDDDDEEKFSGPSILKLTEEKNSKPQLKKQYSFSMDSKFHEEFGRDGWKAVKDLSSEESSSEEESELESTSSSSEEDVPIRPQTPIKRKIMSYSSDSEQSSDIQTKTILKNVKPRMKSVETQTLDPSASNVLEEADSESKSESEEIKYLSSKTVEKILMYGEPSNEYVQHYSTYLENKGGGNYYDYDNYTDDDRSVVDVERSGYNEPYDYEDDRAYRPVEPYDYDDDRAYPPVDPYDYEDDPAYPPVDPYDYEDDPAYPPVDPYDAREPVMPQYRDDNYADDERTLIDEDEYYRDGHGQFPQDDLYRGEADQIRGGNYEMDKHPRYYDEESNYDEYNYQQQNNYHPNMVESDHYYK